MNPVDRAEKLIAKGGHAHLIGAGGIGMAGIAFLLKERGLFVTGCDLQQNRQTDWLRKNGIQIFVGHDESHIANDVDWLVRSTAVPDTHPEVRRAKELEIPISLRGEVLPALMRDRTCIAVSGTHGKTTTTAMIAQVLGCGYCIGGEIAGIDGVAKDAPLMVVEADESDGTVAGYTPDYAVITNIEYDHMEHHASKADFIDCFRRFVHNTKEKVFYCADDPIAVQVVQTFQSAQEQAGKPAPHKCEAFPYPASRIPLPLPGNHNQWNAVAALAVSKLWKSEKEVLHALENIKPIRRRFETVFEGRGVQIVSDYAHHPTEIAALVQTALELEPKRLLAVFQPHRHTRTLALGAAFPASFHGVENLWLVPVYAASEQPLEGGTTKDLMAHFPEDWKGRLHYCQSLAAAWAAIQPELRKGDLLLIIGAGNIEQLAEWANSHFVQL
ncbi:MAG: UDP-N-acetylmuramate--L-alanine ligase [Verrucomicrobiota bacterium]